MSTEALDSMTVDTALGTVDVNVEKSAVLNMYYVTMFVLPCNIVEKVFLGTPQLPKKEKCKRSKTKATKPAQKSQVKIADVMYDVYLKAQVILSRCEQSLISL